MLGIVAFTSYGKVRSFSFTEDHSKFSAELVRQGRMTASQVAAAQKSDAVTRALGVYAHVQVDTFDFELAAGDKFFASNARDLGKCHQHPRNLRSSRGKRIRAIMRLPLSSICAMPEITAKMPRHCSCESSRPEAKWMLRTLMTCRSNSQAAQTNSPLQAPVVRPTRGRTQCE